MPRICTNSKEFLRGKKAWPKVLLHSQIGYGVAFKHWVGTLNSFDVVCFLVIIDVDAKRGCQTASFSIGSGDTPTRAWDIKVTQYGCGNEDESGPAGCLQWFTETEGTISRYYSVFKWKSLSFPKWFQTFLSFHSFNFPTGTNVIATATHLSNQEYNVCIKQSVDLGNIQLFIYPFCTLADIFEIENVSDHGFF